FDLRDDRRRVLADLRDGIARPPRILRLAPKVRHRAGRERGAFDGVTDGDRGADLVVVFRVVRPAELMHHRPDEQGRVRDATADDDVRTLRQTARDVVATHVRVRRDDVLADAVDVFFARVQVRKLDPERTHLVEVGKYVVAGHDRDLQLAEAKALGDFDHLPRRGGRIGAAGVGNDLESLLARQSGRDRKSTRLNSSHRTISYAVFCLKKKKKYRSVEILMHETF